MKSNNPKRKKQKQGAPAWLLTFGDLLTLLLTFFVLEISFASLSSSKMKEVISSLRRGFGVLEGGTKSGIEKPKVELPNPYFVYTWKSRLKVGVKLVVFN